MKIIKAILGVFVLTLLLSSTGVLAYTRSLYWVDVKIPAFRGIKVGNGFYEKRTSSQQSIYSDIARDNFSGDNRDIEAKTMDNISRSSEWVTVSVGNSGFWSANSINADSTYTYQLYVRAKSSTASTLQFYGTHYIDI